MGFQFLIGRLVTCVMPYAFTVIRLFQFLIGRLVTNITYIGIAADEPFQFLIGRLVTLWRRRRQSDHGGVSIPHR